MTIGKLIYIYPLPVRVWHWIIASGFVLLILTGFQIRYAEMLNFMTLSNAIALHNYVGFAVIANFSTDGSKPTKSSMVYKEPVLVSEKVILKAFDAAGKESRTIEVE